MALSTLSWTKQVSDETLSNPFDSLRGYRLVMTITGKAVLLDKYCFVMQKTLATAGGINYQDAFYCVASVANMADINDILDTPTTGFYRTDSIDMFFENLDELNSAITDIEEQLKTLCLANDISLSLKPLSYVCFPENTNDRYWGTSLLASLTGAQVIEFLTNREPANSSRPVSKVFAVSSVPNQYLYIAIPSYLGDPANRSITLNEIANNAVRDTVSVTNPNGFVQNYLVHRTAGVVSHSTNHTFAIVV